MLILNDKFRCCNGNFTNVLWKAMDLARLCKKNQREDIRSRYYPEGCYVEGCVKKSRFLTSISLCIQHMTMVTVEDEYAICDLLNSTIFSDREWPLRQISTIRHYLPLNIAEREQGRYTVTRDYTHWAVYFWMTLSELAKFPTTWSVARPLRDSWASCLTTLWLRHSVMPCFWGYISVQCLSACRACDYVYIDYVRRSRSSSCRLLRPINCQTYITLRYITLQSISHRVA